MNKFFSLVVAVAALASVESVPNMLLKAEDSTMFNMVDSGVKSIFKCLNLASTTDQYLGELELKPELYCTASSGRNLPGVTCCTPQNTTDFELKFLLYMPGQSGYTTIDFYDPRGREWFKDGKDLVFLVTGFLETVKDSPWVNGTRDGFLALGHPVIQVDWSQGNELQYWQSMANLRTVGAAVGHSIIDWDIIDRVLVAGLSLGGQTVGEVGKYVREKTGRLVKECHGLDPAGPFFDGGHDDMILDKGDCKLVQVIHTSASTRSPGPMASILEALMLRLGTSQKSGHCDYWVNCGHAQESSCMNPSLNDFFKAGSVLFKKQSDGKMVSVVAEDCACSHMRAGVLYQNSVLGLCDYESYECPDCGGSTCSASGPVANSLPPYSHCDPSMDVNYMLKTTGSANYCSVRV